MVKIHPRIPVLISAALLAVAVPLLVVVACGPDFQPDVFTPSDHPEDLKVYAAGKLGILQPGFWQADKIVAYRYLTGGHLSAVEQAVYDPPPPPSSNLDWQAQERAREDHVAANRWLAARAEFSSQALAITPSAYRTVEIKRQNYVERDEHLDCTDNAFEAAIVTLRARAATWGLQSADLKDWIAGQDAVFSNCAQPGSQPSPTPAGASPLLRQDRAYQVAAAYFYAANTIRPSLHSSLLRRTDSHPGPSGASISRPALKSARPPRSRLTPVGISKPNSIRTSCSAPKLGFSGLRKPATHRYDTLRWTNSHL